MRSNEIISKLPNVKPKELIGFFPKINVEEYPELSGYSWEDCHKGSIGAGDLFLACELGKKMKLQEGMKILELGAGNCLSSIYLSKKYKVEIYAADLWIDPTSNWKRVKEEDIDRYVKPIKMDARDVIFPEEYFDVIFSMNSYFYFGTDDLYLPYILKHLKKDGIICIASPCYAQEFDEKIPKEFLFDPPENKESYSIHSPLWWENHFKKIGLVEIIECCEHPKGREFWLDSIRWRIENGDNIEDFTQDVIMLLKDDKRLLTYFTLLAKKW